jgi:hypothetical protein
MRAHPRVEILGDEEAPFGLRRGPDLAVVASHQRIPETRSTAAKPAESLATLLVYSRPTHCD